MIPAGGIDDFQIWRCHAESHHPREQQRFVFLSPLTNDSRARFQVLDIGEQVQRTSKPQT